MSAAPRPADSTRSTQQQAMRAIETANPDKLFGIFGDVRLSAAHPAMPKAQDRPLRRPLAARRALPAGVDGHAIREIRGSKLSRP